MSAIHERLKALRLRAGLSMEEAAKDLGFARASSYQYYESATGYDRDRLPAHMIEKLRANFVGKGKPPILQEDIDPLADGTAADLTEVKPDMVAADLTLAGAQADAVLMLLKQSYGVEFTRLSVYSGSSNTDARLALARRRPKASTLLSARNVAAIGDAASLVVVTVDGDNMAPTINAGSFAVVDTTQDAIAASGIYAVVIAGHISFRRCQHDAETGQINMSSDNQNYKATERVDPKSIGVVGRAVWVTQRL